MPNAGAIDEALLRPGRCFATVTVRRLTQEEGRGLALRLCGGDAARAERVLAGATSADQRSVSTAEIYQSWGRLAVVHQAQDCATNVVEPGRTDNRLVQCAFDEDPPCRE